MYYEVNLDRWEAEQDYRQAIQDREDDMQAEGDLMDREESL